ncbi:GDSL-type esterase/lipase family protein (plasmid) [Streptomyces sp. SDT5-1]|uniref:GDSL-type esterase/lipase family protein n=1 Tax=Streptomyces sp. SDT5-1 TaxID=3406418 RepID=UPI003FD3DBC3
MNPLLPAAALLAAAALAAVLALSQTWLAGLRIVRANRGKGRGILARSGLFHPTEPVQDRRPPLVLGVLGDSLAAGLGASCRAAAPTDVLGQSLADRFGRTVRVVNVARVGSRARDLPGQHERLLRSVDNDRPDFVVIVTGANDLIPVPFRTRAAARALGNRVKELTDEGARVVAATCPALGAVTALPRPARTFLNAASLRLAHLQEHEVLRAGGDVVALHREISPAIAADPETLLSADGFHPSDAGYLLAATEVITRLTRRPTLIPRQRTPATTRQSA